MASAWLVLSFVGFLPVVLFIAYMLVLRKRAHHSDGAG
jgi:cbb3-type cytochrome oxidase subunit 3